MTPYQAAVDALLREYRWNPWFLDTACGLSKTRPFALGYIIDAGKPA